MAFMFLRKAYDEGGGGGGVRAPRRPVVGLALGAGAARGWAHIGVLDELDRQGLKPDIVVGCSIGAVVGGAYAAGKLAEIEQFSRSLTKRRVLGLLDLHRRRGGLTLSPAVRVGPRPSGRRRPAPGRRPPRGRHHEFRAFAVRKPIGEDEVQPRSAAHPGRPYECTIREVAWEAREAGQGWRLHIAADRFLHHMVRFLVGTMIDIGLDRRPVEDMAALLAAEDNQATSPPAPPQGL